MSRKNMSERFVTGLMLCQGVGGVGANLGGRIETSPFIKTENPNSQEGSKLPPEVIKELKEVLGTVKSKVDTEA